VSIFIFRGLNLKNILKIDRFRVNII